MEPDRTALLAAMYDQDDDETADAPPVDQKGRSRKIRVGIIEYEVPTLEYVSQLEQVVMAQRRNLEQQRRAIYRLQATLSSTRNFLRHQTNTIREMDAELDKKIGLQE